MSNAMNFLVWLVEDANTITATADTPRDAQLKQYTDEGYLTFAYAAHGDNTYAITSKWMQEIRH